jgi:hypothetical protein
MDAETVHFVVLPLALVAPAITPDVLTLALDTVFVPLAQVVAAVSP